jgi:hypothetical protein
MPRSDSLEALTVPVGSVCGGCHVEGRYAGTLSPVLMNSRTDGALAVARLMSATAIQAEFVRYGTADVLCCPSRTSAVMYRIRPDEIPELMATHISTRPNAPQNQSASTGSSGREATLFGDRWRLTAIGDLTSTQKGFNRLVSTRKTVSSPSP